MKKQTAPVQRQSVEQLNDANQCNHSAKETNDNAVRETH